MSSLIGFIKHRGRNITNQGHFQGSGRLCFFLYFTPLPPNKLGGLLGGQNTVNVQSFTTFSFLDETNFFW